MSETFFTKMKEQTGVELNDAQKQAVLHTEGPLLLLASPGSGKTTTLNMKIAYLLFEKGVPPEKIMAVTFSKASARDMSARFEDYFAGWAEERVAFSTIHSFAFKVVRAFMAREKIPYQLIEGGGRKGRTMEGVPLQKTFILKKVYEDVNGTQPTEEEMEDLMSFISFVKNRMLEGKEIEKVSCQAKEAPAVFKAYESFKHAGTDVTLLDFDDMLTYAHSILLENEDLLRHYQQQYEYVLTDESQDNSVVQHELIDMLAAPLQNVCLVADDDQSIFGWRGAEVGRLLHFKETYPEATVLTMTENYRSSEEIVQVANGFIKRNVDRFRKEMTTPNGPESNVGIHAFRTDEKQLEYVVEQIRNRDPEEETAVLYRNHSSVIPLVDQLDKAGIDFYMKDLEAKFFRHWIVEDILNFLRFSYNDGRVDILERIHTKFNAYISKKQMTMLKNRKMEGSLFDQLLTFEVKEYQKKAIPKAKETFREMNGMAPEEAIFTIREKLGYDRVLRKMVDSFGFRADQLFGTLDVLSRIASGCTSLKDFAFRLKELEELVKNAHVRESSLTLTTFHSAKGLEFDTVYMIDLVDGIIPSDDDIEDYRNGEREAMEEAARLFYVGMTRARTRLELLTYHYLGRERVKESTFLNNVRTITGATERTDHKDRKPKIDPSRMEGFEPGTLVVHKSFGEGTVMEYKDDLIVIHFEEAGYKELLLETCLERGLLSKRKQEA